MIEFLTYDLKVAVLLAVFYMFYRLMLARETFHRVNRIVLLLTAVASFVLPLCVITMHETVMMEMPQIPLEDTFYVPEIPAEEPQTPLWQILLPIVFIIGMVATLTSTLWSLFRIVSLISKSEKHPQTDGTIICVTGNADMAPFSWMIFIVMNRSDYEQQDAAILTHERGHIRLHHSWDLLLVDALTALQWFNPAIWMLRSDLRAIHEYEADGEVLSKGINARQYQYLLITKAASIGGYSLANGISHSILKNRINMMLHKKSKPTRLLKLLIFVPIVAITLAVNAETVQDVVFTQPQKQIVKKGKVNAKIKTGLNSSITVVADGEQEAQQAETKTFKVYGIVKDKKSGEPIIGAVVQIVNSNIGVVTDLNGEFAIDVQKGDALMAVYMGYTCDVVVVKSPAVRYTIELQKERNDKAYDSVDEMPQFPGGVQKLFEFLTTNVRYPKEAEDKCLQGRVIVSFIVEKDGSLSDTKVVGSIDPVLDAEALRVVNSMPNWIPGKQNGEPVRVKYVVPVRFLLDGGTVIPADNEKTFGLLKKIKSIHVRSNDSEAKEVKLLYIVDGKPMDNDVLKTLDPKTIESMEVLKNKSVTVEKYGEKAKNGVIIINTKNKK